MKITLASRNAHKIIELKRMAPHIEWVAMPAEIADPPESSDTFLANAREKAAFVAKATGGLCLADDSGLEVDALGGRPGVWSRRFSPEGTDAANNRFLLEKLGDRNDRRARYRCVIVLLGDGREVVADGSCEGEIGRKERGHGGFGYDPLFLPEETPGRTMAELSPEEKDAISHRGRALRGLLEKLGRAEAVEAADRVMDRYDDVFRRLVE